MKKFGNLVLSKEQPVFVDRTVAYNSYLKDIADTSPLTYDEEVELLLSYKKGDISARDNLVKANLHFVIAVAKKIISSNENRSIDILDIIQEGNIGLMKAIEKHDPEKGVRLISYAVYYIRASMYEIIRKVNRRDSLHYKIKREIDMNLKKTGSNITPSQISEEFGIDNERTLRNLHNININPVTVDQTLEDFEKVNGYIDQYSSSIIKNFSESFYSDQGNPADIVVEESLRTEIERSLETLTPREADVVRLYFGLGDQYPMTLEEIGETFDLTIGRVEQIQHKAIRRMKHISRSKIIKGYLGDQKFYNQDADIKVENPYRVGNITITDMSGEEFHFDKNRIWNCTWNQQVQLLKKFGKKNLENAFNKNGGAGSFQKRWDMHYSDDLYKSSEYLNN